MRPLVGGSTGGRSVPAELVFVEDALVEARRQADVVDIALLQVDTAPQLAARDVLVLTDQRLQQVRCLDGDCAARARHVEMRADVAPQVRQSEGPWRHRRRPVGGPCHVARRPRTPVWRNRPSGRRRSTGPARHRRQRRSSGWVRRNAGARASRGRTGPGRFGVAFLHSSLEKRAPVGRRAMGQDYNGPLRSDTVACPSPGGGGASPRPERIGVGECTR